jgi:hypothetical protein
MYACINILLIRLHNRFPLHSFTHLHLAIIIACINQLVVYFHFHQRIVDHLDHHLVFLHLIHHLDLHSPTHLAHLHIHFIHSWLVLVHYSHFIHPVTAISLQVLALEEELNLPFYYSQIHQFYPIKLYSIFLINNFKEEVQINL